MNRNLVWQLPALVLAVAALAAYPLVADGYYLALGITMMNFIVLATAWALFSGPTRYISLATAAFYGIGAYTMTILWEQLPEAAVVVVAALIAVAVALVVGLSTLRLRGMYFVIFTFGLAELIRQVVTWYETKITGTVGRYIYLTATDAEYYWKLLALAVAVFFVGWLIGRSRLGLALRVIGDDETVARHVAINTTRSKLVLFAISAAFMAAAGAITAPRLPYIEPIIAFNPLISFQVVIMALLGGAGRLYGPLLGVVPLVVVIELIPSLAFQVDPTEPAWLQAVEAVLSRFSNNVPFVLGIVFIVVVYFLPGGILGLIELWRSGGARLPTLAGAARSQYSSGALLELVGVRKTFGGLVAVDEVSFSVAPGEIVGLIGPNGSGKTTALNLISGALRADRGEIRFRGLPINALAAHEIARLGIARTFQLVRVLENLSCRENVIAGLAFRHEPLWGEAASERADALLERVGLGSRSDMPAAELTYIDQKRLELARALALDPELLLLDEWLAGLNARELQVGIELVHSLRQEGLTVVLVEHVMDAIRSLCDRCIVMNAGRTIADGPPAAVLADREVIAAYIGDAVA